MEMVRRRSTSALPRVMGFTVIALGGAALGCREPTEAVIDISTDSLCSEVGGTGITAGPLGDIESRPYGTTTADCNGGTIGSIVLVPPGDDRQAPFAFKIVTSLGKPVESCVAPAYGPSCIVARRAMRYVPHRAFHVPIRMSQACAGVLCPADQSCLDGVCHSATLDPNECDDPEGCEPPPGVLGAFAGQYGGPGQELGRHLALANDGTLAVTGSFDDALDLGGTPLKAKGGSDIFLATFTKSGLFRWSASFGGAGADEGTSVAIDAHGSVYLAATFEDAIDFGGGPLVSKGASDVALVKLTTFGGLVWAQRFGGAGGDSASKVAVDKDGNVYVSGAFSGSMKVGDTTLDAAGDSDGFVVSFDRKGDPRWAKALGGPGADGAQAVDVDASGRVHVSGFFQQQMDVGAASPLVSLGTGDVYLASFERDGKVRWARSFGAHGNDVPFDLAVSRGADGSPIVVTGTLAGEVTIDGTMLPAKGGAGFVTAFDGEGKLVWSNVFGGGGGINRGTSVSFGASGDLALAGDTYDGMVFGTPKASLAGHSHPFVAILHPDGTPRWAKSYASSLFGAATGVVAGADGSAYLTGWFDGKLLVEGETLDSKGRDDMILLRAAAP